MLIDTRNTIENLSKSLHAKGIIASLLGKLNFSKDDKKISVAQRQQLSDLVCWLFAFGDDEQVLQMGDTLLQITPESDQDRWSPIDLALSMPWLLAQRRGDANRIAKYEAKMVEAVAKRLPAFKAVFEKVEARQMNGEHLHDDEITKAQAANNTVAEVRATIRQLKRLCWILARGASEKMSRPVLEDKIKGCQDFLSAHVDVAFADVYPA
jgi:hypothetical protein